MNWNQLHTSATPEERLEFALLMLRTIEERNQRIVLSRGRLVREKRGPFPGAHYLNDRRRLRPRLAEAITKITYIFILLTVSVATWLFVMHAPAQLAAPVLTLHLLGLTAVLLFKPYQRKSHFARSA